MRASWRCFSTNLTVSTFGTRGFLFCEAFDEGIDLSESAITLVAGAQLSESGLQISGTAEHEAEGAKDKSPGKSKAIGD